MAMRRSGGATKRSAVRIKRAYEARTDDEGHRVLVDRLWPRGIRKEVLAPDEWVREVAPSDELRKWFAHEPERWPEFQRRYRRELASGPASEAVDRLVEQARSGPLTLLYSAHDEERNQAVVLAELIGERLAGKDRGAERSPERVGSTRAIAPSARSPRQKKTTTSPSAKRPRAR